MPTEQERGSANLTTPVGKPQESVEMGKTAQEKIVFSTMKKEVQLAERL